MPRSMEFDLLMQAHSPRFSAPVFRAGLDAVTKFKKVIDDMITQHGKELADEIWHNDFCTDEVCL